MMSFNMISMLTDTVSEIEWRMNHHWSLPTTYGQEVPQLADNATVNHLVDYPKELADGILRMGSYDKLVEVERLVNMHHLLSSHLWCPLPKDRLPHEQDWYRHDLLVYCALSRALIVICKYHLPREWKEKMTPMTHLLPRVSHASLIHDLMPISQTYSVWLDLLSAPERNLPLLLELSHLEEVTKGYKKSNPMIDQVHQLAKEHDLSHLNNLLQEEQMTKAVKKISHFVDHRLPLLSPRDINRGLLRRMLVPELEDDHWGIKMVGCYLETATTQLTSAKLEQEIEYWQLSRSKVLVLYHQFLKAMHELLDKMNDANPPLEPHEKLYWNESGEKLAVLFVDLIRKGLVKYRGHGDLTNIAKVIYHLFSVSKIKGEGFLTEASFLSYLKKAHSE